MFFYNPNIETGRDKEADRNSRVSRDDLGQKAEETPLEEV